MMARLVRTISKFFIVLVMLFGNPPVVRLRDLARRPAVALVATTRHPTGEALPQPGASPLPLEAAGDSGRHYIPVKAA